MEDLSEHKIYKKQRHGFVTAWITLMIIINSLNAILHLFATDFIKNNIPLNVTSFSIILLGLLGVANVFFSVLLYQWKKIGFWGFVGVSIVGLTINLSIGMGTGKSIFGLIGIIILYGVLQIKKDNVSAWDNLE